MNISVYLFGDFNEGYSQYPDDYSQTIFKSFAKNAQAITQIAIHRDGDLMYYGYIRKLENEEYVGLCAMINGKYITHLDGLFAIFEQVIESMTRNGYLIHYSDKGNICSEIGQLYENREEIDLITSNLQAAFEGLDGTSRELPAVNYGAAKDSVKSFSIQDDEQEIIKSSYTNSFTFIYKSKGYNTAQMNSYRGIIARKDNEIENLRNECLRLKSEASSLKNEPRNIEPSSKKRKTRNKIISIACWLLLGKFFISIIIFGYSPELDFIDHAYIWWRTGSTDWRIVLENNKGEEFSYESLEDISGYTGLAAVIQEVLDEANRKDRKTSLPFNITACSIGNQDKQGNVITAFGDTIYSYQTKYLIPRLTIQNENSGYYYYYTMYYKLYTPNGTLLCSCSKPLHIYSGSWDYELIGWNTDWGKGKYKYEFYCNGDSLGEYEFTIY